MKVKLSPLPIYILGLCIALILISYAFFDQFLPNRTEADYNDTYRNQLQTEADKMPQAQKRVQQAIQMANSKAATWNAIGATHTPPRTVAAGGIDLSQNAWQLTVDAQKYRNSIQRVLNAQVKKGGVTVLSAPLVPPPDVNAPASTLIANYFNYPAIPFPVVIFDLGAVTVRGTYAQITANVRAYRNMPDYLAVADGLRLDGTSPDLTGTYNLTIVGFIHATKIFPSVPEGAATAGGGGRVGGGPPAGIPGMPGRGGAPGMSPGKAGFMNGRGGP